MNVSVFRKAGQFAFLQWRLWFRSSRVLIVAAGVILMSFFLSENSVHFALDMGTTMQAFEPFIWSFGDRFAVLWSSLLLIVLFSDLPFQSKLNPFLLTRSSRPAWLCGQIIYVVGSSLIYVFFFLFSTVLLTRRLLFPGNVWSMTAALLGYTSGRQQVALPMLIDAVEITTPYEVTAHIIFLLFLYSCLIGMVMLFFSLRFNHNVSFLGTGLFVIPGYTLDGPWLETMLNLMPNQLHVADRIIGWVSPASHVIYYRHNFGYNTLPKLWHSYVFLIGLCIILAAISFRIGRQTIFIGAGASRYRAANRKTRTGNKAKDND